MFNDKRLTFNETLSATSLLVSLTQGDNSFGSFMGAIQTINEERLTMKG